MIILENLTKIYRKRHLGKLKETAGIIDLNLEINKGEVFSLLGLNGTGKTTTIKLMLGLLFPTKGRVVIDGKTMLCEDIKKKMGYLPEIPLFYRTLTPREVLRLYGRISKVQELDSNIDRVLEIVRMEKFKDKRMAEFSKGMLQRIGIAQAMLHDPSILIFDEPASGLDPLGIMEMRQMVLKLKEQGKTIFFSSHIISEVEKFSDRVGILVKNRFSRVIEQKEWSGHVGSAGHGGRLEEIFIEEVKHQDEESIS